jgi:hypothetical protein
LPAKSAVISGCFVNSASAARAPPSLDRAVGYPARVAVAAMFLALVVHTMVYAAFLEDPFSWVLMAVGMSLVPSASLVPARWSPASAETAPAAREGPLAPGAAGLV